MLANEPSTSTARHSTQRLRQSFLRLDGCFIGLLLLAVTWTFNGDLDVHVQCVPDRVPAPEPRLKAASEARAKTIRRMTCGCCIRTSSARSLLLAIHDLPHYCHIAPPFRRTYISMVAPTILYYAGR